MDREKDGDKDMAKIGKEREMELGREKNRDKKGDRYKKGYRDREGDDIEIGRTQRHEERRRWGGNGDVEGDWSRIVRLR